MELKKVEVIFQRKHDCFNSHFSILFIPHKYKTSWEVFGKSSLLMRHDKHSAPETKRTKMNWTTLNSITLKNHDVWNIRLPVVHIDWCVCSLETVPIYPSTLPSFCCTASLGGSTEAKGWSLPWKWWMNRMNGTKSSPLRCQKQQ